MKLQPWEPDVRTIVDRISSGDIDLQPDFQRQEIWSRTKKKKLIDTILREWSIPPIHLVVGPDNRLEVLDGQQRLASLKDFYSNKFSISGNFTPTSEEVNKLHGKFYKNLEEKTRRLVDNYTIRCFRITDYSPEEPSELFYRLNQPAMLTSGEQRNALFGPAREQLKKIVDHFEACGNSKETIGFSNIRLSYDDIFARILFFIERGGFDVKGTESRISDRFRKQEAFDDDVFERVISAITYFSDSRSEAGVIKLNKASALSFLLFYSRFIDAPPDNEFMAYFKSFQFGDASAYRKIGYVYDLFVDRASLRVTDVSSVALRDFSLFYLYMVGFQGRGPGGRAYDWVSRVHDKIGAVEGAEELGQKVEAFLDLDEWCRSL